MRFDTRGIPGPVLLPMCRSVGRFYVTESATKHRGSMQGEGREEGRGCHRAWGMAPLAPATSELSRPWASCPTCVLAGGRLQTVEPVHSCLHSTRAILWLWPSVDGHRDVGGRSARWLQLPVSGLSELKRLELPSAFCGTGMAHFRLCRALREGRS